MGPARAQAPLDVAGYVERVLSGSLEARVVEREAALGRAEAVGAGVRPNPELAWERQRTTSGTRRGESQDVFRLGQLLPFSGRRGAEAEAAEWHVHATEARRVQARAGLRYEATRAFAAVLAARERRSILERSLAELRTLAQAIAVRERAGEASGQERLRIELEAATVEGAWRGTALDVRRAEIQALRLLGPEQTALPPLTGTLPDAPPPPEEAGLLARLERRGDVRALEFEARGAEALGHAARRGWLPDAAVHAGLQLLDVGQPGAGMGYVVGVALPLPVFDRRQGPAARAEAERELARARRAALLHEARTQLRLALEEVADRRERLAHHQREVLGRARELRQVAFTGYRGGSAELLLLVDAERAAREAELTTVELTLSRIEAETDLLLLAGADADVPTGSPTP